MIKLGSNLRVMFTYLVQKVARDGKVPLTVIRDGKEVKLELPVSAKRPMLIPSLQNNYPSYFVWGPLVFSSATADFIGGFSRSGNRNLMGYLGMRGSPLVRRLGEKPAFAGERLVVVSSPFFPHKLSKGYSNPTAETVKTVNGVAIKNLEHLVEVLRDAKSEFVRIEFDARNSEALVFPRAEMAEFRRFLETVGYPWIDESQNPAYRLFLG